MQYNTLSAAVLDEARVSEAVVISSDSLHAVRFTQSAESLLQSWCLLCLLCPCLSGYEPYMPMTGRGELMAAAHRAQEWLGKLKVYLPSLISLIQTFWVNLRWERVHMGICFQARFRRTLSIGTFFSCKSSPVRICPANGISATHSTGTCVRNRG